MVAICITMVRIDERLANLEVVYMVGNILGDITWLNDIGFLNIKVKYHRESQSKKVPLLIKFIFFFLNSHFA